MEQIEYQDNSEREFSSPNTAEQDPYLELQLIIRQRQINDLLTDIEDLRSQTSPLNHVPYVIESLINTLTHEKQANNDEIRLLQQVINSSGNPQSERAIQEKLMEAVEQNRALGQQLGLENMERLFAERALLRRENELLKESEAEMKQALQHMVKQKHEVDIVLKKYAETYGLLDKE